MKIDKSFIYELDRNHGARAIVAAIVELSHALDLVVVAEGVETRQNLRVLEDLRCDRAQGFLFGASADPAMVDAFVIAGPNPALRLAGP